MRFLLGVFILLVCASTVYSESVILVPSKEATEDSVKNAIPFVLKRCETYGYSGMTAGFLVTKDGPVICLTSPSDIGNQMRANIVKLFAVSGKSADLCQVYVPTEIEKEQFQPGNSASPKGTSWVFVLSCFGTRLARTMDGKTAPPILIHSERALPRSEMNIFIKQKTIEVKSEALRKRNIDGQLVLRLDGTILLYSYGAPPDALEQGRVSVYKVSDPVFCFKKCGRCNGMGFSILRIPETIVVGPLMPGASRGSPEQYRRVECSSCSGTGKVSDSNNDVIQLTFDDCAVFAWVAVPLPFSCAVITAPTGFLPPPAPPAAIQAPGKQSAKCSACSGSGICAYCKGTGIYHGNRVLIGSNVPYENIKCSVCSGGGGATPAPGKCVRCRGTGQVR